MLSVQCWNTQDLACKGQAVVMDRSRNCCLHSAETHSTAESRGISLSHEAEQSKLSATLQISI